MLHTTDTQWEPTSRRHPAVAMETTGYIGPVFLYFLLVFFFFFTLNAQRGFRQEAVFFSSKLQQRLKRKKMSNPIQEY